MKADAVKTVPRRTDIARYRPGRGPATARRPRVAIVYKSLPAYRSAFFDTLRDELAAEGVDLMLVHGDPIGDDRHKGDSVTLPWARRRRNRSISVAGRRLVWQPVTGIVRTADLVIVEQASKLLVNYVLLLGQSLHIGPKVAFWGHGANLNARTRSGPSEWAKARYSRLAHWFFAYTDGSRKRVVDLGFPGARVTVVQNAADTELLRKQLAELPEADLLALRQRTGARPGATALFIGSLYVDKRLPFLLQAALLVHQERPDFVLLIAGDGPAREETLELSRDLSFVHWLGRSDGPDRVSALAAADCILMPGLVGLAILDSFAAQAPMVTTRNDSHSPEIEYLLPGQNGVLVEESDDPHAYARAVLQLLADGDLRARLREGCLVAASTYTTAQMVTRFRDGVIQALRSA